MPNLLGGGVHDKDEDEPQDLIVEFEKSSNTTATVPDNSSIGSSTAPELSSSPNKATAVAAVVPKPPRRGMMSRMGSLRDAIRGSSAGGGQADSKLEQAPTPKPPSAAAVATRRGGAGLQRSGEGSAEQPGPSKRNLLQRASGSMRNVLSGSSGGQDKGDAPAEQAPPKPTTQSSKRNLLQKTGGSMRNVLFNKGRSQRGLTPTTASDDDNAPTPLSPRRASNRKKSESMNKSGTPSTPRKPSSTSNKRAHSKRNLFSPRASKNTVDNADDPEAPTTPLTSKRALMTTQESPREQQGPLHNINDSGAFPSQEEMAAGSSGKLNFDPAPVEQSPGPEQQEDNTYMPRPSPIPSINGEQPSMTPTNNGGKAKLTTIMCPSPSPRRLSMGSEMSGNSSQRGRRSGSVSSLLDNDGSDAVAAAAAARELVKQHILPPQVPQSPFGKCNARVGDTLRVPNTPDHSVSQTIKSVNTNSIGTSVFDKMMDAKEGGNDSFGFEDSGWNADPASDEDGVDIDEQATRVSLVGALNAVPGKSSSGVQDQASAVSCLTDSEGSDCPITPSRQVNLRKDATVSSVFGPPPPLQLDDHDSY